MAFSEKCNKGAQSRPKALERRILLLNRGYKHGVLHEMSSSDRPEGERGGLNNLRSFRKVISELS